MSIDVQAIFQTAVLVSGSSALAVGINAITGRRKVQVDSARVLSDGALAQVVELRAEIAELKKMQHDFERLVGAHFRWDAMVLRKLNSFTDEEIPDPPALWL